jgi:heparan-alpha-glucosaminide N-acetyltransferase
MSQAQVASAHQVAPAAPSPDVAPKRIESIDTLRGLTILVMIFVNDLAGVKEAPPWMKHMFPHDADGMTFVDVVFPAFLFIVGMSIPFGVGRRLERGEPLSKVWRHILTRTLELLAIGVLMVNGDTMAEGGILSPPVWNLLMYVGVILVWNVLPRTQKNRKAAVALRAVGAALLFALAVLYHGRGHPGFIELRPQWWGVLGLIGWAYLVACTTYIAFRRHIAGVIGMSALLYCVFIANSAGRFATLTWITRWVDIGSMLGSYAALVVSGVALGMILTPSSEIQSHRERIRWGIVYGFALAAAGYLLHSGHEIHRMFIINKIFATPPWCLWSAAITIWFWLAIYYLMDVRGWKRWAIPVEPAGQNALLAYVLAPLLYALFGILASVGPGLNFYERLGTTFAVGFWRSVVFAFGVTWLAGALRRMNLQLRL